jgi:hypothetical protein
VNRDNGESEEREEKRKEIKWTRERQRIANCKHMEEKGREKTGKRRVRQKEEELG